MDYENQSNDIPEINDMPDISDAANFDTEANHAIIKVIGVGGGGGNAVNYMYRQNVPGVNFAVLNTDRQHLDASPVPNKLLLGESITHGRGAGNKPEIGRQCAEASADDIRALFEDETEMVFITAGMGGGTGTGAAPIVAQLARDAGMLTIGIVTVPFMFEGDKKIEKAIEGASEMKKHVDALLVINNENIIDLYKDYNLFNAFLKADDTLANAARSISEIISETCYINVDFQDVKTILKDSGTAIISTGYGEGEHRITQAIHDALHSPLLKSHDINSSRRLLFKFVCWKDSPNPLKADEVNEITQFTSKLPPSIDVKWGIGDNPEMGDRVKITVLASGFDLTLREGSGHSSDGSGRGPIIMENDQKEEKTSKQDITSSDIEKIYGADKLHEKELDKDRRKYVVLSPAQFDDHEVIDRLEKSVAYNRDPRFKSELDEISQSVISPKKGKNEHKSADNDDSNRIVFDNDFPE